MDLNHLQNEFRNGHYDFVIQAIKAEQRRSGSTEYQWDWLLLNSLIRGNYTDQAVYSGLGLYQLLHRMEPGSTIFNAYYDLIKNSNVIQTGLQILRELKELEIRQPDYRHLYQDTLQTLIQDLQKNQRDLVIYPMVWPIAFGDMIALHQFAKQHKQEHPDAVYLLIMPLNRPELIELAELNRSTFDYCLDITLLAEEKDRLRVPELYNQGLLNVSHQEHIINGILRQLELADLNFCIEKTRYLPVLEKYRYQAGWRVWEKRAELFLSQGIELPKLVAQTETKRNQITLHQREANYGDPARNTSAAVAQQLIDTLHRTYPDVEVVRLGDPSMTPLDRCRDVTRNQLNLREQIKLIQQSRLFIGCHSAPQHLAVAASDTPVICTNYTTNPFCVSLDRNICKVSNEPVGAQVKAVLYNRMFNPTGTEVIPTDYQPGFSVIPPSNDAVMAAVHQLLNRDAS